MERRHEVYNRTLKYEGNRYRDFSLRPSLSTSTQFLQQFRHFPAQILQLKLQERQDSYK